MYKLTFKKRVWIVKQKLRGVSTSKICLAQSISRMTVSDLVRKYKDLGWEGLKDSRTGRPETILNKTVEIIVLDLRRRYGYGACRIEQILKKKGFGVSHRQIEKVLVRNNMVTPNPKKQRPRKWVRYEVPNPNDLWHTDWTRDPYTDKQFTVYIDDKTRLVTSYGIFRRASSDNSIALLKTGIAYYGKPKAVMTDHGGQYYTNHPGANNQDNNKFGFTLKILGIKHVLARINRPQTNGKVERFFKTYKEEYASSEFTNLKEYIKYYNEERLHMSLQHRTPQEAWKECKPLS